MSQPDISVLMPIWNANELFLIEALESVISQDFANWELVIVEAPSNRLSNRVVGKFADRRIHYHLQAKRTTLVDQLNFGLRQAKADLVARFDADDVCEKNRLSSQLQFLNQNPTIDLVGSQLSIIDENGNIYARRNYPTHSAEIENAMQLRNVIAHPAATFRKKAVLQIGGYDPKFAKGAEDYDLWVRMLENRSKIANMHLRLLRYRHHPKQVKVSQLKQQLQGTIAVKEAHFGNRLCLKAKFRLFVEKILVYLPSFWVAQLFQWTHLKRVKSKSVVKNGDATLNQ